MNDWRSKSRIGRSVFIKHLNEIREKLNQGYTNRQIYFYLVETYQFALSESQFNRYIKKYCADLLEKMRSVPAPKKTIEKKSKAETVKKIRNPSDLKKLREQSIDLEDLQNYQEPES
ncbi:hypothetical protein QE177_15510 (plasmid) [Arsenophonus sp. aPb]|uniref:hypothetical protein n=1 Tax=Arsenophonus sp. aPb TaxID=3041619 RepID=UPI0024694118|nr:hypothetical protein [Arsenophonus sp. aPb]WGL99921.1 hypothetical protein QE177_15510 [Arsenophonus sp. aPb]